MASIDPGDVVDRLLEPEPAPSNDPRPAYSPERLVDDLALLFATVGVIVDIPDRRVAILGAEVFLPTMGVRPDYSAPGIGAKQAADPTPSAQRCLRCGNVIFKASDHGDDCPDSP